MLVPQTLCSWPEELRVKTVLSCGARTERTLHVWSRESCMLAHGSYPLWTRESCMPRNYTPGRKSCSGNAHLVAKLYVRELHVSPVDLDAGPRVLPMLDPRSCMPRSCTPGRKSCSSNAHLVVKVVCSRAARWSRRLGD